ncbi:MAG TPA: hypothetical protein VLB73_03400 [Patescibacteria group bacterium]|nr:hypothetical protein [Patescibacteria group bacterium]
MNDAITCSVHPGFLVSLTRGVTLQDVAWGVFVLFVFYGAWYYKKEVVKAVFPKLVYFAKIGLGYARKVFAALGEVIKDLKVKHNQRLS